MWCTLLAWLLLSPAAAGSEQVRADRAAVVGLSLAGAGLATTGVGAWLRWSGQVSFEPQYRLVPSAVMGGGTVLMYVGSGLASFESLRSARLRGAPIVTGSVALGFWTASIATQLLFAYGAPAALATVSSSLALAQLRVGRRDRLSLRLVLPRSPGAG